MSWRGWTRGLQWPSVLQGQGFCNGGNGPVTRCHDEPMSERCEGQLGGENSLKTPTLYVFFGWIQWLNTMKAFPEDWFLWIRKSRCWVPVWPVCFRGDLRIWSFDWFGCASNTNGRTELDPWISFSKSIRKTVPAPKLLPMSPVFHEPVLVPEELELDSVSWQPWRQVVSGHAVDHMSVWIEPIRLHLNSNRRKILQVNCNAKYV